jgi:hypothetical protein
MIRWVAASFGITAATIHATAIINIQWLGWIVCLISISLWYYIAILDKDRARQTQQIYFLIIALIAVYNWLKYI